MFQFLRKLFNFRSPKYYETLDPLEFTNEYSFSVCNEELSSLLVPMLQELKNNPSSKVEEMLTDKPLIKYTSVDKLINDLVKELDENVDDFHKEFVDEPDFGYRYYLCQSKVTSNSVEVVYEVYDKGDEIGSILSFTTIKYRKGLYYQWKL